MPQIVFRMGAIKKTINPCVGFVGQPHDNKKNLEKMNEDVMIWKTISCDTEDITRRNLCNIVIKQLLNQSHKSVDDRSEFQNALFWIFIPLGVPYVLSYY